MIGKVCGQCGRINCAKHKRKAWASSTRRSKTKSGWSQQRRNRGVMALHRGTCHICGWPGADEIDHVVPLSQGGSDTAENLRPIHRRCHQEKTQREAREAKHGQDGAA